MEQEEDRCIATVVYRSMMETRGVGSDDLQDSCDRDSNADLTSGNRVTIFRHLV